MHRLKCRASGRSNCSKSIDVTPGTSSIVSHGQLASSWTESSACDRKKKEPVWPRGVEALDLRAHLRNLEHLTRVIVVAIDCQTDPTAECERGTPVGSQCEQEVQSGPWMPASTRQRENIRMTVSETAGWRCCSALSIGVERRPGVAP